MIFHFRTNNVTFFEEDQDYFETKLSALVKSVSYTHLRAHETSLHLVCRLLLEKNKHESGERFEAHGTISCAHHGKFHAEVSAENILKCADLLEDKLGVQMKKFHDKHKG